MIIYFDDSKYVYTNYTWSDARAVVHELTPLYGKKEWGIESA
tara:strand:- start:216 stop:341 length:126 start_codon:yes stop_codon:yes gene_type:complete